MLLLRHGHVSQKHIVDAASQGIPVKLSHTVFMDGTVRGIDITVYGCQTVALVSRAEGAAEAYSQRVTPGYT